METDSSFIRYPLYVRSRDDMSQQLLHEYENTNVLHRIRKMFNRL